MKKNNTRNHIAVVSNTKAKSTNSKRFKDFESSPGNYNYSSYYHNSQDSNQENDNFTNLIGKVRDKRLTESLEILEQQGVTGSVALFLLRNIQEIGEQLEAIANFLPTGGSDA